MQFSDLRLVEPLLRALVEEGYTTATPIQAKAIGPVLDGHDVLGSAQTGTGKTAAFALPILQHLADKMPAMRGKGFAPRCLVLAPTRELVSQIAEGFTTYGRHLKLKVTTVFGGVSQYSQEKALRNGVDVLVAAPGRLLDLCEQGLVDLRSIQTLVLDEADRMLDMGFIHPIRRIAAMLPAKRQTLMFSATMPVEIRKLADTLLNKPVRIEVAPVSSMAPKIEESVYFVEKNKKPALLAHLFEELGMARTIVFTRTKHGADKVVKALHRYDIRAEAIHGNKSQNARQRALENFKNGKTPMLIATDIASRGIDVDMITHVVNFDLTHEPETYIHRVGRTGRAGHTGIAVSFCDSDEKENLRQIEKLTKRKIRVADDVKGLVNPNREESNTRDEDRGGRGGRREGERSHGGRSSQGSRGHGRAPQGERHSAPRAGQPGRPASGSAQARPGQGVSRPHARPHGERAASSHSSSGHARPGQPARDGGAKKFHPLGGKHPTRRR
jgi:ATP-dependent RNA helicase RhlE